MKYFLAILCFLAFHLKAQQPRIHTDQINIARDSYGVPHIFAPTDPEVAYGLAWAHAEDDFKTIQTLVLTGKGKLSTYLGKKGAPVDYVFGLLNTRKVVDQQIKSMDPRFIQLLQGYLLGLEAYGKAIKQLRQFRQMSQTQLAEEAQLRVATISEIEAGKANFNINTLIRISNIIT